MLRLTCIGFPPSCFLFCGYNLNSVHVHRNLFGYCFEVFSEHGICKLFVVFLFSVFTI